jgi:hypothetical protein
MLNKHKDKPLVWAIFPKTKTKIHARLIEQLPDGKYVLYCPVHNNLFEADEIKEIAKEERW